MRSSEALSGAIPRVHILMAHLLPHDHVIKPHLYHFLDLKGSLRCSSHEIWVGVAPNLLEIPWLPYNQQV